MPTTPDKEQSCCCIGRDSFGHWLSGFVDGEGSFILQTQQRPGGFSCHASLRIELRDDDSDIINLIKDFWQVGNIYMRKGRKRLDTTTKPNVQYVVSGWETLNTVIVPHFTKYPLRAKKKRDFEIWKDAVDFAYRVSLSRSNHKWTELYIEMFSNFVKRLNETRLYTSTKLET